ncbi:MAG TPA: 2-oxoglutarate ferredoxin oxidoreductase subunit alpha, partial [Flavisolibacter sp.]|nr:2-oxoglutarate ferredoxin oxidoreductase subunit alpha [Flavisolibacter sp.]
KLDNGPEKGDLLVLGWGSTYGVIKTAVEELISEGYSIAHAHLRYIRPFPRNLDKILSNYKHVLIPEINSGQLIKIIRDKYLVDAKGFNKVMGVPITKMEIIEAMKKCLRD